MLIAYRLVYDWCPLGSKSAKIMKQSQAALYYLWTSVKYVSRAQNIIHVITPAYNSRKTRLINTTILAFCSITIYSAYCCQFKYLVKISISMAIYSIYVNYVSGTDLHFECLPISIISPPCHNAKAYCSILIRQHGFDSYQYTSLDYHIHIIVYRECDSTWKMHIALCGVFVLISCRFI